MSALQLGLIVAGVLLVIGVVIYNSWQERRARRAIAGATARPAPVDAGARRGRTEPTLGHGDTEADADARAARTPHRDTTVRGPTELPATPFAVPMDNVSTLPSEAAGADAPAAGDDGDDDGPAGDAEAMVAPDDEAIAAATFPRAPGAQPDPDIECIVALSLPEPVTAAMLSSGLHARIGKTVRWFGRTAASGAWHIVTDASPERYTELAACLLLADRNGAASVAQVQSFLRVAGELGAGLGARVAAPDVKAEVQRAEALDRLCADLDVQIGLSVVKPEPGSVAGTRLRGVAEAAGFHLAPGGRFEFVQEDTGRVLYTLQNVRSEPFTPESLRMTSSPGVVFLLDVPRVAEPVKVFDQMKLAAKRMAHTLGAELVDDNRRPLDDPALAKIRAQVQAAAEALAEVHIEPGSPRAHALFGA
jgi:FtsZ-interacting cell division protein ZipA